VWAAGTTIGTSNPLGKVPCRGGSRGRGGFRFARDRGIPDTLSPVGKMIPPPGRERAEVKTWEALADGLLDAAILARLESTWAGRTDEQRSQAWTDRQLARCRLASRRSVQGLGDKPFAAAST
jgi:hypothetical protein